MSQPVKISDELLLDARLTAELSERSIAGQIEFWARLGRAVESILGLSQTLALKKSGDELPLSKILSSVDTEAGRRRVSDYIKSQPYPHYEMVPDKPGFLLRIEESGARTLGKFVNRKFQAAEIPKASGAQKKTSKGSNKSLPG